MAVRRTNYHLELYIGSRELFGVTKQDILRLISLLVGLRLDVGTEIARALIDHRGEVKFTDTNCAVITLKDDLVGIWEPGP